MGYRVLFLTNPLKLSVKNEQLLIDNGVVTSIPLEDIECIACDTMQVTLNTYLLSKFSEYSITFFVTDKSHHPSSVCLPLLKHSRHLSVLNKQIELSVPKKKQLWKQVIYKKIENQATVLNLCDIKSWINLDGIKYKVKSGDSDNMEAVAASKYFRLLFGNNFTRAEDSVTNACLNYGYAILRSTIEKYLVSYGFEPSLGLFHKSSLNNFNLADDLIECYRPVVDLLTKEIAQGEQDFSKSLRAQLVDLLSVDVVIDSRYFAVSRAIELTVQSLSGYLNSKRDDILLPSIVRIEHHEYE